MNGWSLPTDNAIVSAISVLGGILSAVLAGRIKRSISRDGNLIRGYDRFTEHLSARITVLEGELHRREKECRERLDEADRRLDAAEAKHRECETVCAQLRLRLDRLENRLP